MLLVVVVCLWRTYAACSCCMSVADRCMLLVVVVCLWRTDVERSGSRVEIRTLDSTESCAAVLKPWASVFILHCSSSPSYMNEYMAIDNDEYVYEQPSRINCSMWLDASQRS